MKTAHINAPGALRSWTRTLIILALAVAMFAATAVAPALATGDSGGEGDGDIDRVRAEVTETYTYKIGLLTEKMNNSLVCVMAASPQRTTSRSSGD